MRVLAIFMYKKGFLGSLSSTQQRFLLLTRARSSIQNDNFVEASIVAGYFQRINLQEMNTSKFIKRYSNQTIILFTLPSKDTKNHFIHNTRPCIFHSWTWWFALMFWKPWDFAMFQVPFLLNLSTEVIDWLMNHIHIRLVLVLVASLTNKPIPELC